MSGGPKLLTRWIHQVIVPSNRTDQEGWKLYQNEVLGFAVRYPDELYSFEDGGYIPLVTFLSRDSYIKEQYGDIQVLLMGMASESGEQFNAKDFEGEIVSTSPLIIDDGKKKVYFDRSSKACGAGIGYCPVPGEAFIFGMGRAYAVRRLVNDIAKYSGADDNIFEAFLRTFDIY